MVKIVGIDQSAVRRVTCRNCASILEYTQSEVKERQVMDFTGGGGIHKWIECPKCNNKIFVSRWE